MRTSQSLIIAVLLTSAGVPDAHSARARKATLTYAGSGSAGLNEAYSRSANQPCVFSNTTTSENASSVQWNVTWQDVAIQAGANPSPQAAMFTALSSRSDSTDCPVFNQSCTAMLQYFEGVLPSLTVEKSGKSFIVSLLAEQQTEGVGLKPGVCMQSSIFDNAIVEGMKGINITRVRVKLTPARRRKKFPTSLLVGIQKVLDCTDPARNGPPFLSNTCTLTTDFSGSVQVSGKWKAEVLPD